ncbi:MAG: Flp pilus assembly protein CpaB [Bacillota bacterium]
MRKRINLILIVAVVFGLVAAWGTYEYLQHLEKTYKASGNFVAVAVAKTRIPAKQVITDQMVVFTEMPTNYVTPSVVNKPEEIIGKIARSDIYPGEQILKSKVAGPNDPGEGLAMIVEPGRRAMTIAVNEITGVAGMLSPGDHVDVLGTVNVGNQTITSTIVQNIKVLAVNKTTSTSTDNKPAQSATLTLSLNPGEAQQLTLAAEKGSIRVTLRTPTDKEWINVPSSNLNHLVR